MKDNLISRLQDAMCSANLIYQWTAAKQRDALEADNMLRPAIEWRFIVIGRALSIAGSYDESLATKFPRLHEWINYGNHLVSEYKDVNPDELWRRATIETTVLIQELEQIIQGNP